MNQIYISIKLRNKNSFYLPNLNEYVFLEKWLFLSFDTFSKKNEKKFFNYNTFLEQYVQWNHPTLYFVRKRLSKKIYFFDSSAKLKFYQSTYSSLFILKQRNALRLDSTIISANTLNKKSIKKETQLGSSHCAILLSTFNSYVSFVLSARLAKDSQYLDKCLIFNKGAIFIKRSYIYPSTFVTTSTNSSGIELNTLLLSFFIRVWKDSPRAVFYGFENTWTHKMTLQINRLIAKIEAISKYNSYSKFYTKFSKKDHWNIHNSVDNAKFFFVSSSRLFINYIKKDSIAYSFKSFIKPSDIIKNANLFESKKETSLSLRKNKIFNKGRYSRNRQLYRTGVYWSIWLNIILVFGLYYLFYRFTFNFGYFWLPLGIFIISIFFSRLVKYRLYLLKSLINEFFFFSRFVSYLLILLISCVKAFFKKIVDNLNAIFPRQLAIFIKTHRQFIYYPLFLYRSIKKFGGKATKSHFTDVHSGWYPALYEPEVWFAEWLHIRHFMVKLHLRSLRHTWQWGTFVGEKPQKNYKV